MKIITYETVEVATEGVALDLLIWRRFHKPMTGLLEALLDHPDNQGLADAPAILPVGTLVTIPIPQERVTEVAPVPSLWD